MIRQISYGLFLLRKTLSLLIGTGIGNWRFYRWGVQLNGRVNCFGVPYLEISPTGTLRIGRNCTLRSSRCSNVAGIDRPVMLSVLGNGNLNIGDECGMSGTVIVARQSVTLGRHVMLGANVTIADTDFHPLDAAQRTIPHSSGKSAPIVLEDDVFVGMNSLILKGVTIGARTVIAAGSVVTKSLPPDVVAGGNPARILKELPRGENAPCNPMHSEVSHE